MEIWLLVAGIVGQALALDRVARGRSGTWWTMGALYALLVPLTLLAGVPSMRWTPAAVAVGVTAGLILFVSTRVFLSAAAGWTSFMRDARHVYRQRSALPVPAEVAIGGLVAVGEELFWRGLAIAVLESVLGMGAAAFFSLVLFVAVNGFSRSRPAVVAALVGGCVWTWLAVAVEGGLSSAIVCHLVWTTLMIAVPPRSVVPVDPEGEADDR